MAAVILEKDKMDLVLERMARELVENHGRFDRAVLIGLQPRGIYLSRNLKKKLETILKSSINNYGELDITFYRDDFRTRSEPLVPNEMNIDFSIEGKEVVLIDDVIYSGRSLRAALDALLDFGRPDKVEFMSLIDRRFSRQLPVEPDYIGMSVDSRSYERVKVEWRETEGENQVWLVPENSAHQ